MTISTLTVVTREGSRRELPGELGLSLMEILRNHGIDELVALCGGHRSCGTCHVYIDADRANQLPAISAEEEELLEASDYRQATSRLSCQVPFEETFDGLVVTVAPAD
jgi:ferredoxin, 2Fe-2S